MTGVVSLFSGRPDAMRVADWRWFLADPQRTCRGRLACPWELAGVPVLTRSHVMMSLVRRWDDRLWLVPLQTSAARLCEDRPDDDLRNLFDRIARRSAPAELGRCPIDRRAA